MVECETLKTKLHLCGGASGIGLKAKAFADAGMKVVLADLRRDALDEAVAYFEKDNCLYIQFSLM